MSLADYQTLVFDCDGVVLNSNQVKIDAYFETALGYGASEVQAQALVDYHVMLGGISRYHKFEYFLREILHVPVTTEAVDRLLEAFGRYLDEALLHCELAPDLQQVRAANPDARWMMVSGGDQDELRRLFARRQLDHLFEAGIYGSPHNKDDILAREQASGNLAMPALFYGDSRYDHQASTRAGLDFLFVSHWTDMQGWQDYCAQHQIRVVQQLSDSLQ